MCENMPNGVESMTKKVELVSKIHTNLKKQSQFASLWPEIRSTKLEILNKDIFLNTI